MGAAVAVTPVSAAVSGLVPLRLLLGASGGGALRGAGRHTDTTATWRVRGALVGVIDPAVTLRE